MPYIEVRGLSVVFHNQKRNQKNSPNTVALKDFSLDVEKCLGCCAMGPVMAVDGIYYSNPSTREIKKIIASCE